MYIILYIIYYILYIYASEHRYLCVTIYIDILKCCSKNTHLNVVSAKKTRICILSKPKSMNLDLYSKSMNLDVYHNDACRTTYI